MEGEGGQAVSHLWVGYVSAGWPYVALCRETLHGFDSDIRSYARRARTPRPGPADVASRWL